MMSYLLLTLLIATSPCLTIEPPMTLEGMVRQVARDRGMSPDEAWTIVLMESAGDPSALGDWNGNEYRAVGLWQFHPDTWEWACELTGHVDWRDPVNRLDPVRSSIVAVEMITAGWGRLWTAWRILHNE